MSCRKQGFDPATGRNCGKSKSWKINAFLPENALMTNFYTYLQPTPYWKTAIGRAARPSHQIHGKPFSASVACSTVTRPTILRLCVRKRQTAPVGGCWSAGGDEAKTAAGLATLTARPETRREFFMSLLFSRKSASAAV